MKILFPILLAVAFTVAAEPVLPAVKLPPQAREVSLDEVQKLMAERPDIGVLDVRTSDEFAELGRLPGAKHLDYFHEQFPAELMKMGLDPSKPCIVYCALGGRAKRAAAILAQAGFKDIVLPAGGFNAWKKSGKPVEGSR